MFISINKKGQNILLNLDKVAAIRQHGATIEFLGELILQGFNDEGGEMYGNPVIEVLEFESESQAVDAMREIVLSDIKVAVFHKLC